MKIPPVKAPENNCTKVTTDYTESNIKPYITVNKLNDSTSSQNVVHIDESTLKKKPIHRFDVKNAVFVNFFWGIY